MAKASKSADAGGIRLSEHPKARRQIARAKGWGGLAAFGLVLYLSLKAGLPTPDALLRGMLGGLVGFLLAWGIAVTVWRHLALAEIEAVRRSIMTAMEKQVAAADAAAKKSGDGAQA
jgi:uncharacterized membrane protein YccC